jgi:hypothetical protein
LNRDLKPGPVPSHKSRSTEPQAGLEPGPAEYCQWVTERVLIIRGILRAARAQSLARPDGSGPGAAPARRRPPCGHGHWHPAAAAAAASAGRLGLRLSRDSAPGPSLSRRRLCGAGGSAPRGPRAVAAARPGPAAVRVRRDPASGWQPRPEPAAVSRPVTSTEVVRDQCASA